MSLSDISTVAVIALPLNRNELVDLPWLTAIFFSVQQDLYAPFIVRATWEAHTLLELKMKIEKRTGTPRFHQSLQFNGQQLSDNASTPENAFPQPTPISKIGKNNGGKYILKLAWQQTCTAK